MKNNSIFENSISSSVTLGKAAFYKAKQNIFPEPSPLYLKKSSAEILLETGVKNGN